MIKNLSIAVIGLGYVGLPLLVELSKKYKAIGFDKDNKRINELLNSYDRTLEVSADELNNSKISFSANQNDIADCNVFIITVPTPVDKDNSPDMFPLSSAS